MRTKRHLKPVAEFRRLHSAQDPIFEEAFSLYETSFPKHEQRLLDKQAALMQNPLYHFNIIVEDTVLVGILLYWEGSGYVYIEHFAIHPLMRGKAMGSRILEVFCRDHSCVVLEIDMPVDEISIRRERFYQRLGFKTNDYAHIHPAYQKQFSPHELVVMSYPQRITEKKYQLFQTELKEIVMKDTAV